MTGQTLSNDDLLKQLGELMRQAQSAGVDVQKLAKATKAEVPTILSVTMRHIVSAQLAGAVLTDNVNAAVQAEGAALGDNDIANAKASSTGALIRYVKAHDAAMTAAGYEWSASLGPTWEVYDGLQDIAASAETPKDETKGKDQSRRMAA